LACNRLEFTQETFTTLLATTDWRYVHELFVYDDGSQDGTREWLAQAVHQVPVPHRFVLTHFGSPVTAMVHFIEAARAPLLAKTDNDAMLPPGWLRQSLEVFARHPELTFLGIEALYPHVDDPQLGRSYTRAEFISGLGLYRREPPLR
jgi:cellulose synthase/poly-beta-1,6-N-acetylglucosamine synthase-like glycosyltransferase